LAHPGQDVEVALCGGATALVLDVAPVWGVQVAAAISRRGLANVVLVLPRWPHRQAILPCDGLVAALLAGSRTLGTGYAGANVVFVLDGERAHSVRRPLADARVDNRYELSPFDLPNLRALRAAGVQRVVRVTAPR
jgi:hypothetical protein